MSHKQSIKHRLTVMITATSISVMLLSTVSLTLYHISSLLKYWQDDAITLTKFIGNSISAALVFHQHDSAKQQLDELSVKKEVIHALLFDKKGALVAQYVKPGAAQNWVKSNTRAYYSFITGKSNNLPDGQSKQQIPRDKIITAEIASKEPTLLQEGKLIWIKSNPFNFKLTTLHEVHYKDSADAYDGFIAMQFDLNPAVYNLFYAVLFIIICVVIAIAVVFMLANRMQQSVSTPIYSLLNTMQQVSVKKNYALRATKYLDDEVGKLVQGFNDMLAQIESRDYDLDIYRNHLEEKVIQRTHELEEAMKQAISANEAKSRFIATMSHEIRTPLNAVLGFAQILLLQSDISNTNKGHIQTIADSGKHLLGLINDILDFSRITVGAVQVAVEPFYLDELLRNLNETFSMSCQQKQLSWHFKSSIKGKHGVMGDQGKLRQVLINLLGNAIKFTDAGEVQFNVSVQDDLYTFAVSDTGPGIEQTEQENIFSPFHQEQSGIDKGGAGLGLAITKNYVELMNGRLTLRSIKGQGSCFSVHFNLPLAPPEALIESALIMPQQAHLPANTLVSALVVDDIENNRRSLCFVLQSIGAQVYEAENGQQALSVAEKTHPDIIFMDIRMPVMDGRESLYALRRLWKEACPPCVAVTASAFVEDAEKLYADGFVAVIAKPFQFQQIYKCFKEILNIELLNTDLVYKEPKSDLPQLYYLGLLHELPVDFLVELRKATEFSAITQLNRLLQALAEKSEAFAELAEFLRTYVNKYDMDALQAVLNR